MELVREALGKGQKVLSEYESKSLLKSYGIPVVREAFVKDVEDAIRAASEIGYPVVLKACSPEVAHKTEKGLIELNLRDGNELVKAFAQLQGRARFEEGGYLVQEWVQGNREFVMGMIRDPQFGPCVMFGLGGIFTEVFQDVTFRIAPVKKEDTLEMFQEIKSHKLLGSFRGMKPVNRDVLTSNLIALGKIGLDHEAVREIDVNPLVIRGSDPIAVDALVVLKAT